MAIITLCTAGEADRGYSLHPLFGEAIFTSSAPPPFLHASSRVIFSCCRYLHQLFPTVITGFRLVMGFLENHGYVFHGHRIWRSDSSSRFFPFSQISPFM